MSIDALRLFLGQEFPQGLEGMLAHLGILRAQASNQHTQTHRAAAAAAFGK